VVASSGASVLAAQNVVPVVVPKEDMIVRDAADVVVDTSVAGTRARLTKWTASSRPDTWS
jgi:hypothetical protein